MHINITHAHPITRLRSASNVMKMTAELNNLRMAPRKVRLVADAIRGKRYKDAERALKFLTRKAARPLEKLLHSAAANAKQNFEISDQNQLVVSEVRVDAGVTLQRRRARARGSAFPIRKRTSHVTLVLEATGAPRERRKKTPANIEIIRDADTEAREIEKREREPEVSRKPTKLGKDQNFVQRMFQRKAI